MHWGYCRVSSEEQLAGQSIDSQFRRLIERGIPEDQVLVEVGSATKGRTPELQRLFRLGREGKVKSITAVRQDRFQSNRRTAAALWELIDQHVVAFRFLDQPDIDPADPTSILQAQILGAFAQFETEQLSQRVKNGLEQNKLMKKHHGRPPAGYIAVDGHLRPDPKTWDIYRDVVACYLETGSSTAARRLRHERTGEPWGVSSFARWIQSPALRGAVIWRTRGDSPEVFYGQHEPLMTAAQWDQIQAIRSANRVTPGAFRKGVKATVGSGLMTCNECGRKLIYQQSSLRKKPVYSCPTAKGGGCSQGHTNFVHESAVADLLRKCIFVAANEIAEQTTPTALAEPQELIDLRVEREKFAAMSSVYAKGPLEQIDQNIAVLEAQLKQDGPQRAKAVRDEMSRLRNFSQLEAMTDDELRSFAKRYGLTLRVDEKQVVGGEWTRLGPIFPGSAWGGDLDELVKAIDNAKGREPMKLELARPAP